VAAVAALVALVVMHLTTLVATAALVQLGTTVLQEQGVAAAALDTPAPEEQEGLQVRVAALEMDLAVHLLQHPILALAAVVVAAA
jgi:hypothetical protein